MNIPIKTLTDGFSLPVYGLGIWQMGGRFEEDTSNDEQEVTSIRAAIDAGVTHIDTAEAYGNGHAEELLGRAIQGYDRTKLIIATKVTAEHQTYEGVHQALRASLKRLNTEYVDLYLLHRYPALGIDIKDTMRAMDELLAQGLVKHIGICNASPRRFDEAQKYSQNKLVCNQVHYNVLVREAEKQGVLQHTQESDSLLVAWGPVQKGMLPNVPLVQELAQKYNKTPTQIAINWLVSQPNVVVISKTGSAKHLEENLGALGWQMDDEDIELVRKNYPNQLKESDRFPLTYVADVEVS